MVEFDDRETASKVLEGLQEQVINGVTPTVKYANSPNGRFAPNRQSNNRQGRRDQNSPYQRPDERAGSRGRDHRGGRSSKCFGPVFVLA